MNKLQMHPPLRDGAPARFEVKVQRLARPPAPWVWEIYEEGRTEACRRSSRLYRSAEDAWAVGTAMLNRLGKPSDWHLTEGGHGPADPGMS